MEHNICQMSWPFLQKVILFMTFIITFYNGSSNITFDYMNCCWSIEKDFIFNIAQRKNCNGVKLHYLSGLKMTYLGN